MGENRGSGWSLLFSSLIVRVVTVSGNDDGSDVSGSSVSDPSGVAEVIKAVVSPSSGEGESSEVNRLDNTESGEANSLDALHGQTVVEVTDVDAVDLDLVMLVVGLDGEKEATVLHGVHHAHLISPRSVDVGVHDDDVLSHVSETEVDVENDVVSREKLNGETLHAVVDVSVDVDSGVASESLVHGDHGGDGDIADDVHDWLKEDL
ncbi:hypothetical protein PFISCL1PPCAC_27043, partial [Pristionchus fissidentatus]